MIEHEIENFIMCHHPKMQEIVKQVEIEARPGVHSYNTDEDTEAVENCLLVRRVVRNFMIVFRIWC